MATTIKATHTRCGVDSIDPVYTQVEDAGDDFLSFFKSNFRIDIISDTDEELVFDMVGVDAPIANALRRILLAEVPSVALETVFINKNTSIIQDEILAHRLGLIPLRIDPRKVDMIQRGEDPTDLNTFVFTMDTDRDLGTGPFHHVGSASASAAGGAGGVGASSGVAGKPLGLDYDDEEVDTEGNYRKVYSSALAWIPQGSQEDRYKDLGVGPVHGDILLAKLAQGQHIMLEAHAVKGVGKDHAKFSPVSTASYRLLPVIRLSESAPFLGEEAQALVARCPMGVFDIEDTAGKAVVARPRNCTTCRECVRENGWDERIELLRDNQHFIFSIESTGVMPARSIMLEAVRILAQKARAVLAAAGGTSGSGGLGDVPIMPPGAAREHSQAAMRSAEDEDS